MKAIKSIPLGPHILYQTVVGLGDGSALRVLLESADSGNRDVRLNLARVVEVLGDTAVDLLKSTRRNQVAALLGHGPIQASDRLLSVLKSFLDEADVRDFLFEAAGAGRLCALRSLLC